MWRVFGCQGLTSNDVIIQAMIDAYEAGVDVISMSLGFGSGWPESPDAVVAQRIAAKGIPGNCIDIVSFIYIHLIFILHNSHSCCW